MPTITSYVNQKTWPDGNTTFSFKMDQFTREKLAAVPDGTYIQINKDKEKENTWYMSYKAQSPQQGYNSEAVAF